MCNKQNNLIDEAWFNRKDVFNKELNNDWIVNEEKIIMPVYKDKNNTWFFKCSIKSVTGLFIYSSSLINLPAGLIIRSQYNLCSILCASQPTERLCTKSGVKRSSGISSMSYTKPL